MNSSVTLLPSARRLMDSLREIGYDLPAAVADIVDNSIAAKAHNVQLSFTFEGADSWVLIADDGVGMTGAVLEEAMRYGTQRTYAAHDLGRFGLGLKTASLSQCRRLTVASRRGRERRRIEIRRWDLDHTARTNRWEALRLDIKQAPPEVVNPLMQRPGTVVLWEGLDRVLDYRIPTGNAARHGLEVLIQEVRAHLAMVFHRFISGEARGKRRVAVTLNGSPIDAWDPYARSEPMTRELTSQQIHFSTGAADVKLLVRPYILPSQERFSSAQAHLNASGPQRWNRQQGFYVYRNDRLVQAGGWNRLRTLDEHTKLARIAVDLPPGFDELFGVNVTKMRVTIPRSLREALMAIASGVASEAGASYRRGESRSRSRSSRNTAHSISDEPTLVSALSATERDVLQTVIDLVRDEFRTEPDVLRRLLSRIERAPRVREDAPEGVLALRGRVMDRTRGGPRLRARQP